MKNRRKNTTGGFTLVEVVIASMLVGMVMLAAFPMIITGRDILERRQKEMESSLLGDSVFDCVVKELQNADQIFVGTEEEVEAFCENLEFENWSFVEMDLGSDVFDVEIEIEPVDNEWVFLGVKLISERDILFEREEVVPILNFGLFEKDEIEKNGGSVFFASDGKNGEPEIKIWYRVVSE